MSNHGWAEPESLETSRRKRRQSEGSSTPSTPAPAQASVQVSQDR